MNCNIFEKTLEDYIQGNISSDLKNALEKHMDQCENCRNLYEEEIKIDRDFKFALTIEGIEFNSSRVSIINSIDKSRYSKKTSNKILYKFKRYRKRYISYAVAVLAMIVFIPMMFNGFDGIKFSASSKKITSSDNSSNKQAATKGIEQNSEVASPKSNLALDKAQNKNVSLQKEPLQFRKSIIANLPLLSYELKWKNSADGKSSAAVDTDIGGDVDFGIHIIYIKNINNNEILKYEVINNKRQFTPRNIEWWDNDHLIIVAGHGYGTVDYGSEVYSLEVNSGVLSTLYLEKNKKHQILDFTVVGKDLILKLLIYNDDNYNAFHKAVGKMTLLQADKPVDMQIVSEEKK